MPAPLLFSARAALAVADREPGAYLGPTLAVGGTLSLAGLILLIVATWRTPRRVHAVAAAAVALLGHYLLSLLHDNLGAAATYVGTGMAGTLAAPRPLWAGITTGAGAVLRAAGTAGDALVAVGAAWLAVELALSARVASTAPN